MSRETRKLGRFELLEVLGTGGSSVVHRARTRTALGHQQTVAVKLLKPQYTASEGFRRMFLDEARVMSQLFHPSIVQTLDMGEAGDELFIAMEFVEGLTLRQLLDESPTQRLPPATGSHIVSQVASALDYAHRRTDDRGRPLQIVHRDVTPENILISTDGVVKLMDFGIARALARLHVTEVGTVRGKPHYIAPEQVRADASDRRADIYSLGVVLYETLAGVPPYVGGSPYEILTAASRGEFRRLSEIVPDEVNELDDILHRMLAVSPQDRFQTAQEVIEELLPFTVFGGTPYSSAELGALVRARRQHSHSQFLGGTTETPLEPPPERLAPPPKQPARLHRATSANDEELLWSLPTVARRVASHPKRSWKMLGPVSIAAGLTLFGLVGWWGSSALQDPSKARLVSQRGTPGDRPAPPSPPVQKQAAASADADQEDSGMSVAPNAAPEATPVPESAVSITTIEAKPAARKRPARGGSRKRKDVDDRPMAEGSNDSEAVAPRAPNLTVTPQAVLSILERCEAKMGRRSRTRRTLERARASLALDDPAAALEFVRQVCLFDSPPSSPRD